MITNCKKCDICKNYLVCSNHFPCSVTNRRYYTTGVLPWNCNNVIYLIPVRTVLSNILVLLLISRIVLEYIKAISRPTKIGVGQQSILMVYVKIITIFFRFFLFKLLSKFIVMPQTLKKFYGMGKNIDKASYLSQLRGGFRVSQVSRDN